MMAKAEVRMSGGRPRADICGAPVDFAFWPDAAVTGARVFRRFELIIFIAGAER